MRFSPLKKFSLMGKDGGSRSWTPQSLGAKVLFWGKVSEISGGEMPNKVGADYLTVAGSPYTFQAPNTAPYIAADTDYIWFKTDETQRTTTTAELIGYDLQRTPVKYLDASPNTLEEIVILKTGASLTASEVNSLHAYMHLSMFWSGVENDYGYLKSNRVGQQLWTPESLYVNAEAEALILRMIAAGETPDATRKSLIDSTFTAAKAKAFYNKLDALWVMAGHGEASSKMNWLENDHNITDAAGNPAFSADRGFTTSTNNALKTDFILNTDKVKLSQNSCTIGYYSRTNRAAATTSCNMSAESATNTGTFIYSEFSDGNCYVGVSGAIIVGGANATNAGMWIGSRTASNDTKLWLDTTQKITSVTASAAVPNIELHIGCKNVNGTLSQYAPEEYALAFIGSGFSTDDRDDFIEVFVTGYLTTVGAKI